MDIETALRALGGEASRSSLLAFVTRGELDEALRDERIFRMRHGVYTLTPPRIQSVAAKLDGVLSHHTAARMLNLGTVLKQGYADVTVPQHRSRLRPPEGVRVHYADLRPDEIDGAHTTVTRTVLDCARTYPLPEALAIAESAVRQRGVDPYDLRTAAEELRGPGCRRARRTLDVVDKRPQSPMESVLRGLLIVDGITCFEPQFAVVVDGEKIATADLGHADTMTLIEADSFTWHGNRQALADDCRRYNDFIANGYVVLRFAYEHLLHNPLRVAETVRRTFARRGAWQELRNN